MKYSLNDDRKLYDLCRRYKYLYKRYDEIKHLEKCYWSKHIKDACDEALRDLECTTLEIIELVLGEFINRYNTSVEVHNDVEPYYERFPSRVSGYRCRGREHKVIIDNKELMILVEQMLMREYGL